MLENKEIPLKMCDIKGVLAQSVSSIKLQIVDHKADARPSAQVFSNDIMHCIGRQSGKCTRLFPIIFQNVFKIKLFFQH